jgi:ABC-type polysaccharide/polyol phosphate transport system ATPase subunit
MQWVSEFCTRAVLIEHGMLVADGTPADTVRLHQERAAAAASRHASGKRTGRMRTA